MVHYMIIMKRQFHDRASVSDLCNNLVERLIYQRRAILAPGFGFDFADMLSVPLSLSLFVYVCDYVQVCDCICICLRVDTEYVCVCLHIYAKKRVRMHI